MKNLKNEYLTGRDLDQKESSTTCRKFHKSEFLKNRIRCTYCKPNQGCNFKKKIKTYGRSTYNGMYNYPSWKLTSKNPFQWQDKGVTKVVEIRLSFGRILFDGTFTFKRSKEY